MYGRLGSPKYLLTLVNGGRSSSFKAVISTEGRNLVASGKNYYVYILTNWNNKVMYIGVTNNLERRLYEHKNKLIKGFTQKYNVNKLVYFEETGDVFSALEREKEVKKWRREKKDALVLKGNDKWKDLSEGWN